MSESRVVWKYTLPGYAAKHFVNMPKHAEILSVAVQHNDLVLWALVEPLNRVVGRSIVMSTTGGPIEEVGKFIGTVMFNGGAYVLHIFDGEETA